MTDDTPTGSIYNSSSSEQAAIQYAEKEGLPIGTTIDIRDMNDQSHRFVVERSVRSQGMLDGGGVRVRMLLPPLRGGGDAAVETASDDHIVHARTKAQAALLFAAEAALPAGSYVHVQGPNETEGSYFRTPSQ